MGLFEDASMMKLRFDTDKGVLSVEDIWDLPLTSKSKYSLDLLAHDTNAANESNRKSFVLVEPAINVESKLRFDIVMHIIDIKKTAKLRHENDAIISAKKQKILEILSAKQDESLNQLTEDELKKLLADL